MDIEHTSLFLCVKVLKSYLYYSQICRCHIILGTPNFRAPRPQYNIILGTPIPIFIYIERDPQPHVYENPLIHIGPPIPK